jgi:hypothetical protein
MVDQTLQEVIHHLLELKERNLVEFHHQLRVAIKRAYEYPFSYLMGLLKQFFQEVSRNGIFYIDVINDNLEFFLKQEENLQGVVLILKIMEPICDVRTLKILGALNKNLNFYEDLQEEVRVIYESISNRILEIEKKVQDYKLFPLKDIIVQWH